MTILKILRVFAIYLVSWLILVSSPTASAQPPVRIQIWHQMIYSYREVLAELVKKFESENPGYSVNLIYKETEELRSAFQASAQGGAGPDLIYGPSDQVGPFVAMQLVRPLDQIFTEEEFKDFDPSAVIIYKNHKYMIGDVVGNHLSLIYNKDLISNPPKDTEEFISLAKKLTIDANSDGVPEKYGLAFHMLEPFFFVPWVKGFGQSFVSPEGQPQLDTEATRKAFSFMKRLKDEKILPKECDYEIANALFKEGKAAMIINGDWSWGDYQKAKINFAVARIPMVKETGLWPAPLVSTKGYSINANIKEEKLPHVTKLLKFLLSESSQLEFTKKVSAFPSRLSARQSDLVKENQLLKDSVPVFQVAEPMPVAPELRAVWDALRPQYQSVMGGTTTPEEASIRAQKEALKQIQVMNTAQEPTWQAYLVKALFIGFALWALIYSLKQIPSLWLEITGPQRFAYIMMIPAIVALLAVVVYPFLYNVALSFSNLAMPTFQTWQITGFQNFSEILTDVQFYKVLGKTIAWTVLNLFFHVTIGVFLALVINQTLPAKPLFRVLLIIPWAVPQYITALAWRGMFNQEYGAINLVLRNYLSMDPVQWLSRPFEAFSACLVTNIWLGFPFMMMVALGGLQSISKELYEAAELDGANAVQRFKKITWPLLKPVMVPAITMGAIWTFNSLNVIWLVSNGGEPADQTHILVSYVYKNAFNLYRYSSSAALSMIIFFILAAFSVLFVHSNTKEKPDDESIPSKHSIVTTEAQDA